MLDSHQIREKYLNFFIKKQHALISSSSLIPSGDATLLFTNSGMSPLVPYLLGVEHPLGNRLVNSQKCFRSGDIEEVGDGRHNTFFEMLGNWSLGDYFKKEQLNWWYEFLIDELKLDPNRLYQTVYAGSDNIPRDEESIAILLDIFKSRGIEAEVGPDTLDKGEIGPRVPIDFSKVRIMAYRDKNWWDRGINVAGEPGGPDSETFYDTLKEHSNEFGEYCHLNCDCGRFIEIGNSVFMEYIRDNDGWRVLDRKNVDFGGGLERIVAISQSKDSVFKTDLFVSIIQKIEEISKKPYQDNERAFQIISDHIKSATFIIGDDNGVTPGNSGQNYVVRRLIRRAIRFGNQLDIKVKNWTSLVAEEVINIYQDIYPELYKNKNFILEELIKEEEKFISSLDRGLKKMDDLIRRNLFTGKDAFDLYQSYGFPIEMTIEIGKEKGIDVDIKVFEEEVKKHQELSRTLSAGAFASGLGDASLKTIRLHTATHLTLAALRLILGGEVSQKGSNITSERMRLDFNYVNKLTDAQIKEIELLVNKWIGDALPVTFEELSLDEAKKRNAIGVFDSKYAEKVKVYKMGDPAVSYEICSGPHVSNTSEVGRFKIIKEEAVASGIRRIKANVE